MVYLPIIPKEIFFIDLIELFVSHNTNFKFDIIVII